MAWCPKCKNEYVEGVTICADCGIELVDELPKEVDPETPAVLCHVKNADIGSKFVVFLNYGNIQTAGLMMSGETEEEGYDVVVAEFEREAAEAMFAGFGSVEEMAETDISELVPGFEKQLEEIKFSGISFIVFGILGCGLLLLNIAGVLNFFNTFSSGVMFFVFLAFFFIGISSLKRAGKLKAIVSEEERVTNEALDWIEQNITDAYIGSLFNDELSEEDNYFHVHDILCEKLSGQFSYLNRDYVEQLMDERYNQFCEEKSRA